MNVLCLNVCRLRVPNIMSLGACFKKLHLIKFGAFAWCSVKFALFSVPGLKNEKLIKKANIHKNWNMQTLFQGISNI